jgi:phage replication-related protein YjqB (UPF0714/DUF867 family)
VFADLLKHPGVREEVELRSAFGFLAFHGGALERMTEVIARKAADRAGASLYALVQPPDLRWHIPSHLVTPDESEALAEFLQRVEVVVAVHGYGRAGRWTQLLLGGSNRRLAAHMQSYLAAALPDYQVVADLDAIPAELRGLHPANPVNLPPAGGVQLELPPRVRGLTPHWRAWPGPGLVPPAEALVAALAAAATSWTEH